MNPKEYNKENMAKATGLSMPISTKQAIVISSTLRGKKVSDCKTYLLDVIKKKKAVPFTRFNKGMGHKPGMGPGRFPIKASAEILMLIKSAEANAQFKALNTSSLVIAHIKANAASSAWHYGRQKRRKMKRTNLDIILVEKHDKKARDVNLKTEKKAVEKKQEVKQPAKKEDIKKTVEDTQENKKPNETKATAEKKQDNTQNKKQEVKKENNANQQKKDEGKK